MLLNRHPDLLNITISHIVRLFSGTKLASQRCSLLLEFPLPQMALEGMKTSPPPKVLSLPPILAPRCSALGTCKYILEDSNYNLSSLRADAECGRTPNNCCNENHVNG